MGATTTTADDLLIETYTDKNLQKLIQDDHSIIGLLTKNKKTTGRGGVARTPLHTRGNMSSNFRNEGDSLLDAHNQSSENAEWLPKSAHARIQISDEAMERTQGDPEALVDLVDFEAQNCISDLKRMVTGALYAPTAGYLCQCGTTSTANEVVLEPVSGYWALVNGLIDIGSVVDIGTTANEDAIAGSVTVTAVSISATSPTITVSGSTISTTSSHYVSIADNIDGATNKGINAFSNIIHASSTLGGITVAAEPRWKSYVNSTTTAVSLELVQELNSQIIRWTHKDAERIETGIDPFDALYRQLRSEHRWTEDAEANYGSTSAVKYKGTQIHQAPMCPDSALLAHSPSFYRWIETGAPYWGQQKHGSGKILHSTDSPAGSAGRLTWMINLGTTLRPAHARASALAS